MANVLYAKIQEDMKAAMRAKDSQRLGTIRLLISTIRQKEIDSGHITLNDSQIFAIIDKMIKQRHDSIAQYKQGNRQDLVDKENAEIKVLQEYLPIAMSEEEMKLLVTEAISVTGATVIKDMAKVMTYIKDQAQGKADIAKISSLVKALLK
jgi:uncharacterized protein YqeY